MNNRQSETKTLIINGNVYIPDGNNTKYISLKDLVIEMFNEYVEKERFAVSHNYLDKERYEKDIKKFNEIVNSIDTKLVDIIWGKSIIGFKQLYDVFLYASSDLSDEEFNKLKNDLNNCDCNVFYGRILPIHYWKHRRKYQMKVYPNMEIVYTNEKIHKRFYRKLK